MINKIIADNLTKLLVKVKFEYFLRLLEIYKNYNKRQE